jgi:ABC-type spermidine/putrescine transport system permease subunit I
VGLLAYAHDGAELEEAAAIDGCGPVKIFTKVLLPLMAPGLAASSIFTFVAARQIISGLTAGAVKG